MREGVALSRWAFEESRSEGPAPDPDGQWCSDMRRRRRRGCCLPLRFSRKIALPRGSIRLGNAGTRPRPRNTRGEVTAVSVEDLAGVHFRQIHLFLVLALTWWAVQSPVIHFTKLPFPRHILKWLGCLVLLLPHRLSLQMPGKSSMHGCIEPLAGCQPSIDGRLTKGHDGPTQPAHSLHPQEGQGGRKKLGLHPLGNRNQIAMLDKRPLLWFRMNRCLTLTLLAWYRSPFPSDLLHCHSSRSERTVSS